MDRLSRVALSLTRERRRLRLELWRFLGAVAILVESGFDLGYAWDEALGAATEGLSPTLRRLLSHGGPLSRRFRRLSRRFPLPEQAAWFAILGELQATGAPVRQGLAAWRSALRREHDRDLDRFGKALPLRMNLVLLLFFLPPALLSLIAPLLFALSRAAAIP